MGMKSNQNQAGLVPLRHIGAENTLEGRSLERLKNAWLFFVGPKLNLTTHPIMIKHGTLFVGCHNASDLEALRSTAKSAWPVLRERINSTLKMHLQRIEIDPSDPGPAPAPQAPKARKPKADPLAALLDYYRQQKSNNYGHDG
jgi:hypothetical protein